MAKEAAGMSGGVARLNNMLMQMRSVTPRRCFLDDPTFIRSLTS